MSDAADVYLAPFLSVLAALDGVGEGNQAVKRGANLGTKTQNAVRRTFYTLALAFSPSSPPQAVADVQMKLNKVAVPTHT